MLYSGIILGCKNYNTLDGRWFNLLQQVWLCFFFIFGTDYFAASVGGIMFLYGSLTCDHVLGEHNDCPSESVQLTSGVVVVILTIFLMPSFIHALTGHTMRAYGLTAGFLTVLAFGFTERQGIDWLSDVFEKPDTSTILNWITLWVVLICASLIFLNLEHWASPTLQLSPPEEHRTVVKWLWVCCFGLFGCFQVP